MPIIRPSQYECDNANKGDMVVIKPRPFLYKWYRKNFQKDKVILNIRKSWDSDERIKAYQEDCTLLFNWEILSRCEFNNEVPYNIGINNKYFKKRMTLKSLQFGCENICIILDSGLSILIPTENFKRGIQKVDSTIKNIDINRQVQESLKFSRYKGDFFKKQQQKLDIKEWNISYCSVCGNPVKIKFDKESPYVENTCSCGNMFIENESITWDMVAYWYNSQVIKPAINKNKEFWNI